MSTSKCILSLSCSYLNDCSQENFINMVISTTRRQIWKQRNDCKYIGNEVTGEKRGRNYSNEPPESSKLTEKCAI